MSEALLSVDKREDTSKRGTKSLRRSGKVPGVYYIHGEESVALSVDEKELRGVIHSDRSIIDLSFDEKKKVKSIIREIQWHPVTGQPLHVDFLGVKMTEKVTVGLAIRLVGTATGVKNGGGILQQQLREISIECLPADIPEHFEIDVTSMDVGQSIYVSDLEIENVRILTEAEQSIVTVRAPAVVEEIAEEEVGGLAEPEVIGAAKESDEGIEE